MNTTIRYVPWSLSRELANEVSQLFERGSEAAATIAPEWVPAVDIVELADRFELHVDLPGVDPKSVELTMEKGVLTLAGSREKTVAREGAEARRTERAIGRFQRRFSLPDTVDTDAISARGANGVLEISIPKRPATQPRRIEVTH